MKKIWLLFSIIIISPVFGEVITDFSNLCGATGYKRLYAVPKSFECAPGYFLPANGVVCYQCPNGYTCSGGVYSFNPTFAQGLTKTSTYISSNQISACASNTVSRRMYAIPKSFECASGYFLPANASNCYECPNGYTCSGGVYTFNPKIAQGIVRSSTYLSNNENGTCASNMGRVFNAIFTPNVIDIIWNTGSSTTNGQCTFGQSVQIPNPPTRPGYKFGGWRVKKKN